MVNRIADLLREHGAVEYGDFTLASGAKSSYYLDVKTAITHPAVLMAIGEEMARRELFDVVAGVALGGVPIAVATAIASGKPYAIIRSTEKSYGKGGRIIGSVSGKRVLLVEDVTTSGGSVIGGIEALRANGAVVETVVTVVDREAGAVAALERCEIRLVALSTAREVVQPAE
ncbi:MAG: orotate phosphoribosyltransferase [Methanoregulaceae archaeon]|nr:orotate phosphoribosyltransferase [Methanoregulaceae archaeon]